MASISDIHLMPMYDPKANGYCWPANDRSDTVAHFGRLGCDIPEILVRTVFKRMAYENPNLDVIFVPGDLVGHCISTKLESEPGKYCRGTSYEELLSILELAADLLHEYFPFAYVLPVIGNNDTRYHY